ncbi:hypothetical protein IGI04_033166 [Brassica rapa subsp. trilocularis]|uniref:Uncharacterized protein n=1 Tax=Brassica rapa subsp. trilocularis TaxID=1813537 RepID=A0ABQ7L8Z6_BRACM|nr:hypothetical protein IGI04_033166 [Brassica rapa subsp. trilocularis]
MKNKSIHMSLSYEKLFLTDIQVNNNVPSNQRVVGQNLEQGNNGFAHPTMANYPEFPNYHQEQVIPIPFMIQQENAAPFGALFLSNYTVSLTIITFRLSAASTTVFSCSTREHMTSNQNDGYYNLDQIMAVTSEPSSLIGPPNNLIPNRLYSYPFSLLIDFYSSIVSEKLQTAQCEVLL